MAAHQRRAAASSPGRRGSRGRRYRRFKVVGATVLVLCTAGVTAGWLATKRMMRTAPSWWRQVDADEEHVVRHATAFENAFAEELTRVRPRAASASAGATPVSMSAGNAAADPAAGDDLSLVSEPWSVAIASGPANAWLNTRMKEWAVGVEPDDSFTEWPKEIEQVQVAFRDGVMDVGIRYRYSARDPSKTRVLSVAVRPTVDDEGNLWLEAESIGFGRLQLPPGLFLNDEQLRRLPRRVRELPEAGRLLRTLVGDRPATWNPVVELPDGREVRLLAVRVLSDRLELTCRTEAEVSSAKKP